MSPDPVTQWSDRSWRERSDSPWARGCRLLQGRWREEVLGLPSGPIDLGRPNRLVVSMLPLDAAPDANFLDERCYQAARARLASGGGGIIDEDRLHRNLLSSQPAVFNLLGLFAGAPSALTPWVQSLGIPCDEVTGVEFEHQPPGNGGFGGGSAFDAYLTYVIGHGRGFVSVECKYAENLHVSSITKLRSAYLRVLRTSGHWLNGAHSRLDQPHLRQLTINTLVTQSEQKRGGYDRGTHVVLACSADTDARGAVGAVRLELYNRDRWLLWAPYETLLAEVDGEERWKADVSARYLDVAPVAGHLPADDPRTGPPTPPVDVDGLARLSMVGARVTGEGSVLEQILASGRLQALAESGDPDLQALAQRAGELAESLRAFREGASPTHGQIC